MHCSRICFLLTNKYGQPFALIRENNVSKTRRSCGQSSASKSVKRRGQDSNQLDHVLYTGSRVVSLFELNVSRRRGCQRLLIPPQHRSAGGTRTHNLRVMKTMYSNRQSVIGLGYLTFFLRCFRSAFQTDSPRSGSSLTNCCRRVSMTFIPPRARLA